MGHVKIADSRVRFLVRAFFTHDFFQRGEGFRICDGEYDFTPIWEEFKALTAKVICAFVKEGIGMSESNI